MLPTSASGLQTMQWLDGGVEEAAVMFLQLASPKTWPLPGKAPTGEEEGCSESQFFHHTKTSCKNKQTPEQPPHSINPHSCWTKSNQGRGKQDDHIPLQRFAPHAGKTPAPLPLQPWRNCPHRFYLVFSTSLLHFKTLGLPHLLCWKQSHKRNWKRKGKDSPLIPQLARSA